MHTPPPIIMYDSPEAAAPAKVSGWLSRTGWFIPDNPLAEHQARWDGCTHKACDCGTVHPKSQTVCDACRDKNLRAEWERLPVIEWDGKCMLTTLHGDEFWSTPEDFLEWCFEEKVPDPGSLLLIATEGETLHEVDSDIFADQLPPDGEVPDRVMEALGKLNEAINAEGIVAWVPGRHRVIVPTPADWSVES